MPTSQRSVYNLLVLHVSELAIIRSLTSHLIGEELGLCSNEEIGEYELLVSW
ncbi:hypothetical protein Plhal304r1_c012g0047221 [Plasmopara halstedii]